MIVVLTCSPEAFTIPLPLFPRIIEWYVVVSVHHTAYLPLLRSYQKEGFDPACLLSRTLHTTSSIRALFYKPNNNPQRWDVVLLGKSIFDSYRASLTRYTGGLMGSAFSCVS